MVYIMQLRFQFAGKGGSTKKGEKARQRKQESTKLGSDSEDMLEDYERPLDLDSEEEETPSLGGIYGKRFGNSHVRFLLFSLTYLFSQRIWRTPLKRQ